MKNVILKKYWLMCDLDQKQIFFRGDDKTNQILIT